MPQHLDCRVGIKTVQESFFDSIEFDVYRCKQNIWNKKNIDESHHCVAEFTSEKFNL